MASVFGTLGLQWLETLYMYLNLTFSSQVVQRLNYEMDNGGNGVLFQTGAEMFVFSTALVSA